MTPEVLVPVPCPLCGEHGGAPVVEEGGFTARRCPRCGLVYVSPRPPADRVRAIYEHDEAHTASRQLLAKARDPAARAHARLTLGILRPHLSSGRLLELGPGGGLFLAEARAAGFEACGVEPNPVQRAFVAAEHGLRCVPSLDDLDPDERFDVVYHANVLSHLPDPVAAFRAVHARLAEGGLHVFETGNFADVDARHHALIRETERFQLPDHLVFFGEVSLARLLAVTGFERVALHAWSRVPEKLLPRVAGPLGLAGWARRHRHFVKYTLGGLVPRGGRPQTWIVVARRAISPSG